MNMPGLYRSVGIALATKILFHRILRTLTKQSRKGYHYNIYSVFFYSSKNKGKVNKADGGLIVQLQIEKTPVALFLRKGSSDPAVFRQVFLEKEYYPMINLINSFPNPQIKTIIDAGANIGLTSVLFSLCFPKSKIISIEADSKNFEVCQQNIELSGRSNIIPLHRALWRADETLFMESKFRDKLEWSRSVTNVGGTGQLPVKGISFTELMAAAGGSIDLLKIDIEGAEREFFHDAGMSIVLLRKVVFLVVELHDEMEFQKKFESILKNAGFGFTYVNESLIAFNREKLR